MNKFFKIVYIVISAINAMSSIVLLCVICPRIHNLGFDYMGVIVGVLAILTTILIGWNIFYALELKKDMLTKIDEKYSDSIKQMNNHIKINKIQHDEIKKKCDDDYNTLHYMLNLILSAKSETSITDAMEQLERVKKDLSTRTKKGAQK